MSDEHHGQLANRGSNAAIAGVVGSGVGGSNHGNSAATEVVVYTGADFKGKSAPLAVGRHVLDPDLDDTISSVRVPAGYSVTLYDAPDFSGKKLTLTSDAANLEAPFNDKASSVVVGRAGTTSPGHTHIRQENVRIVFTSIHGH
ncbi:peptidase inhibitor family I36 protein [Streptomyces sp. YGL11-2]|uniref:peptidase inhibitor family I36 protein n=1 Tax=Streptomyces sp. YGL11-2 TaxID=3414028 RepID=UPI003CFB31DF